MPTTKILKLAGVPLLYDRDPAENYGVGGYHSKPYADQQFAQETEVAFTELFRALAEAGFGKVQAILFGGIARTGSGKSYHHRLRAFDLDGLILSDGFTWVANSFPTRPHLYLAIEAVLRQHFGTVLTYGYDARHQDHIHFDNGDKIGFRRHSKSRVLFLQNALWYLFDQVLSIDGVYGPETQRAERNARKELEVGGFSELPNWTGFLRSAAEIALEHATEALPAG